MKLIRVLSATLIVGVFLFSMVALSGADKPSDVGYIKDGIYHDARFGFSVKIPLEWREAKLRKEPTPERLLLVQKNGNNFRRFYCDVPSGVSRFFAGRHRQN
jgi:hypothetical protein